MLHREMLDLKFEDCDFVVLPSKGKQPLSSRRGLSTRFKSLALAASVAGNVLAGAAFLGFLLFLPALLQGLTSALL